MIALLLGAVFGSLIVGRWAESWGHHFSDYLLLSLFLSPLLGAFFLLLAGRAVDTTESSITE